MLEVAVVLGWALQGGAEGQQTGPVQRCYGATVVD